MVLKLDLPFNIPMRETGLLPPWHIDLLASWIRSELTPPVLGLYSEFLQLFYIPCFMLDAAFTFFEVLFINRQAKRGKCDGCLFPTGGASPIGRFDRASTGLCQIKGAEMTWLYWMSGIVVLGLLAYLVIALLRPEDFS